MGIKHSNNIKIINKSNPSIKNEKEEDSLSPEEKKKQRLQKMLDDFVLYNKNIPLYQHHHKVIVFHYPYFIPKLKSFLTNQNKFFYPKEYQREDLTVEINDQGDLINGMPALHFKDSGEFIFDCWIKKHKKDTLLTGIISYQNGPGDIKNFFLKELKPKEKEVLNTTQQEKDGWERFLKEDEIILYEDMGRRESTYLHKKNLVDKTVRFYMEQTLGIPQEDIMIKIGEKSYDNSHDYNPDIIRYILEINKKNDRKYKKKFLLIQEYKNDKATLRLEKI